MSIDIPGYFKYCAECKERNVLPKPFRVWKSTKATESNVIKKKIK